MWSAKTVVHTMKLLDKEENGSRLKRVRILPSAF